MITTVTGTIPKAYTWADVSIDINTEVCMEQTTDEILQARHQDYGTYYDLSVSIQRIKMAIRDCAGWQTLDDDMKETFEMIAIKMARLMNGDKYKQDSWDDILGYTKLVADRVKTGKLI
jgi:hypothetical protein